jgi:hypothetical protein
LNAQENHGKGYMQLVRDVEKKAEADIERLRSKLDAEKMRTDQLETFITVLVRPFIQVGISITALGWSNVSTAQNGDAYNTIPETRQRRSLYDEALSPDAAVKLNKRMDSLFNLDVANTTLIDAKFTETERAVQECAQRIGSLDQVSNTPSQRFMEFETDMEYRFETAVLNTQEGLRHNQHARAKDIQDLKVKIAEEIGTITKRLSSTGNVVREQVHEHTEAFKKFADVIDCLNQRVQGLEKALDPPAVRLQACQAVRSRLDRFDTRLNALEVARAASQTATSTPSTTMTSASELKQLRYDVDTLKSRTDGEVVVSENRKTRLVALEEWRSVAAIATIKERTTVLEKSCDTTKCSVDLCQIISQLYYQGVAKCQWELSYLCPIWKDTI